MWFCNKLQVTKSTYKEMNVGSRLLRSTVIFNVSESACGGGWEVNYASGI